MKPDLLFKLTFLLPLVAVLTVNLSMLALVIAKVYRIKPRPQMFGQARGWLSLALLLGTIISVPYYTLHFSILLLFLLLLLLLLLKLLLLLLLFL